MIDAPRIVPLYRNGTVVAGGQGPLMKPEKIPPPCRGSRCALVMEIMDGADPCLRLVHLDATAEGHALPITAEQFCDARRNLWRGDILPWVERLHEESE